MMLSPKQRRALELLAGSPRGVTEAVLMVYDWQGLCSRSLQRW